MSEKLRSILLTFLFATFYASLFAQQDTIGNKIDLNEVIISASRFEEIKSNVPQQVEVISIQDIDFENPQTTADALQESGKVFVQKSQMGGGSPVIRGFEANRILLVVDGVRLNNAIYRGGHLQNIVTQDNFSLERMEVLFGPSSALYGSDALGGVIHLRTLSPVFDADSTGIFQKANITARTASVNFEKTIHSDVSLGGKKFASLSSFTFSDYDDLWQGSERNEAIGDLGKRNFYVKSFNGTDSMVTNPDPELQVGSAYSQYNFLQKFVFKPGLKTTHSLSFYYSNSSNIPRYDRLTETTNDTTPRYAEWYYGPQQWVMASYKMQLFDQQVYDRLNIQLSYQYIDESRHDRKFQNSFIRNQLEKVNVASLNVDGFKELNKHQVNYGIEVFYNTVKSEASQKNIFSGDESPAATRYPDGGSEMNSYAFYVAHEYNTEKKFRFREGLRYTYSSLHAAFDNKDFYPFPFDEVEQRSPSLTGNIGMVFNPKESWRFTFLTSLGFRVPNVDDLSKVFDSQSGTVIVPNPDLEPEHTTNFETGIYHTFNKKWSFEVIGFYNLYRDIIVTDAFLFNGEDSILYNGELSKVYANVNKSKAYTTGAFAAIQYNLSDFLSCSGTITYTLGRVQTEPADQPLDHIPPVFGKVGLNYEKKMWRVELYSLFNGWKHLDDYSPSGEDNLQYATPEGMPSWYTLNLSAAYSLSEKLKLKGGVENIFDRNYRVFASGISAPGLNIYFALSLHL